MKKLIGLILMIAFVTVSLVACGAKEADYTLGIGAAVTENLTKVQTSVTAAAVVLDADNKIVACRIDAVDVKVTVNEDGTITPASEYKTKAEQGDAYGMLSDYGSKLAEWDDQAKFFENYVVGKTADEVAAIKTGDADLIAGCTIDVADFVEAVVAAAKSEHKVAFKTDAELTAGLAIKASAKDKDGKVGFSADMSAVVVSDGTIVAAVVDSLDAEMVVAEGEGTEFSYKGTKLAQGDSYGMLSDYGSKLAEWYDQAQAFANIAIGKTVVEVSDLSTEGIAGCTMYVGGYKVALVSAASYVR